jgi:hypothetical protein
MKTEREPIKKLWIKLTLFLEREMSLTLLFWLITLLIALTAKIILMVKILGVVGK